MPLNILRLNQRKLHPNEHVVFIKPLPGPDAATAEDFLSRIAAQCFPIMRAHHLSVTTLEEHEPNREFVGRNFNAGETIQLVLKSPGSGRWLPFGYVQMVMMHELAHCMQMNHSRAFWAVRNGYAAEMRELWAKSYTGEGMWGRGRQLYDGQITADAVLDGENIPEHLCGGAYRSRRKKRKAKAELSYQEKKERRIRNKFGPGGEKLGEDELTRRGLEKNKWNSTKPRVAQSKRGRELRAAALLDRLEKAKQEQQSAQTAAQEEAEAETESEYEDAVAPISHNGTHMVKVCEDDDGDTFDDGFALQEMAELKNLTASSTTEPDGEQHTNRNSMPAIKRERDDSSDEKAKPTQPL